MRDSEYYKITTRPPSPAYQSVHVSSDCFDKVAMAELQGAAAAEDSARDKLLGKLLAKQANKTCLDCGERMRVRCNSRTPLTSLLRPTQPLFLPMCRPCKPQVGLRQPRRLHLPRLCALVHEFPA